MYKVDVTGLPNWVDCGSYVMSTAAQGSEQWHELRDSNFFVKGDIMMSCSQLQDIANIPPYGEPEKIAYGKITRKKKIYPPDALERMKQGTIHEDAIRKLYEKEFGVTVIEVGFAIPKWYPFLGSSLDGVIGSYGAIEIKYVKEIKPAMRAVAAEFRANPSWRPANADHLPPNYYAQMQAGMAITGRKWCDFVVYCHSTNELYTEKIFFNSNYWETYLFPRIQYFHDVTMPAVRQNLQFYHDKFAADFH